MTLHKNTATWLGSFIALGVVGLVTLFSAAFTVNEEEQVIILEFGAPVGGAIDEPGLHFKKPFIQEVRRFDKRLQTWDGSPEEIPTKGREFIFVDTTARWRIADPMKFLQSVRDVRGATNRLNDIIDSVVRDEVSSMELVEIVRSTTWNPNAALEMDGEMEMMFAAQDAKLSKPIEMGREGLTKKILARAAQETPSIGVELVDVRLKRVNYVDSVREKVYDRMISERQRIAAQFRSEGEGRSAEILGKMERELREIRSEAYRIAETIRGAADAEAAGIYADAYSAAPEFFAFLRTLESYKETVGGNSTLLLGPETEYFSYMRRIGDSSDEFTLEDLQERRARLDSFESKAAEASDEFEMNLPDSLGSGLPVSEGAGEEGVGEGAAAPEEDAVESVEE